MKKNNPIVTFGRRLAGEEGTAMIEFILIAPILCYMIVAILFMHNHLDYAQDSVFRFRQHSWDNVRPNNASSVSGQSSDDGDFFSPIGVRVATQAAVAMGLTDGKVGSVLAGQRLTGTGNPPYEGYELEINNYMDEYEPVAAFYDAGWGRILGGFGRFFGNAIGTGQYKDLEGLKGGWEDKYPYIVEPWMRQYSENWDPAKFPVFGLVLEYYPLYTMTLARTPVPRVDTRDDRDIGRSSLDEDRYSIVFWECFDRDNCTPLQLTKLNGQGTVLQAIQ